MTIVVTGATGQFGRLVIESLLRRGVPAGDIVAGGRQLEKVKDLADRGVHTALMDYGDPATLAAAFSGADKLLFVSGSEAGQRIAQHTAVVDAATAAGVGSITYTSIAGADTTNMLLAKEHQATELLLRDSGLPLTLLRNGWYVENYTAQVPTILQQGAIHGAAGQGRISAATRSDYADAAAVVLSTDGHQGVVYELGGDESFNLGELAAAITAQTATPVEYRNMSEADFTQKLISDGLPEPVAQLVADIDRAIADNELLITSGDLSRLIGRPTISLDAAIASVIA